MASRVSVILTSYNRPHMVQEAIQSVVMQEYRNWHLVIVDDGSNEETRKVILSHLVDALDIEIVWLARDNFINCRYTRAINAGLERVKGELITYLTDDDYYLPHRLARMVSAFDQNPSVAVVYGNQVINWLDINQNLLRYNYRGTFGVTRNPQCRIDHNSFMHRASCLKKLSKPYWPENDWKNGDVGFFNRLVEHWDFYPIDEVLDVHRWHPNSIQSRMDRGESPIYTQEI